MEYKQMTTQSYDSALDLVKEFKRQSSQRILVIGESLRLGISKEKVNVLTKYDPWFIEEVNSIIDLENII